MQHKKQLFNIWEQIVAINKKQWDNPKFSYDATKAAAMLIEEAIEPLDWDTIASHLYDDLPDDISARTLARDIVSTTTSNTTDVDAFDSLLDSIYIAIGELHKLGLDPDQMVDGLQVVHNCNKQKAGTKDHTGKVTKPADFTGPEAALQAILDKRVH